MLHITVLHVNSLLQCPRGVPVASGLSATSAWVGVCELLYFMPREPFKAHLDNLQYAGVDNHSMGKPSDLVQGTLDLLILKTVSLEPKHGWAIAKRIQQISGEVLQVQQGSLYPALHRLEQKAWIKAKWKETDTGRQAKFYSLTAAGRAQLEKETENWSRLSAAIKLVVETT
jgi:PadR family transcriptional regulator, regulatory protein PadR